MWQDQNKRGTVYPWEILVAIVIILLTGYALVDAVGYTASKFDEKFQVDLCKTLNEIKFGLNKASSGMLTSSESICYTIAKHRDEKTFVPTSKYKQDKEGAELEIRGMIKNCWDMWLKGSQQNMFKDYPFREPCFTCYTFKIKENVNGVTDTSLKNSMEDPFYAKDMSTECSSKGGYWKPKCDIGEEETEPLNRDLQNANNKCCIKGVTKECENRGGKCSQSRPSGEYGLYDKWSSSCPRGQSCYVEKNSIYSYTKYIREYGPRGGDIFFVPRGSFKEGNIASGSIKEATDINYAPGEVYAISFVSPSKQICWEGDLGTKAGCAAKIGTYGFVVGGVGALVVYFGGSIAGAVGTVGWFALKLLGVSGAAAAGAIGGITYYLGVVDNLVKAAVNGLIYPIESGSNIPNFIIVSTKDDAENLGCNVKYSD